MNIITTEDPAFGRVEWTIPEHLDPLLDEGSKKFLQLHLKAMIAAGCAIFLHDDSKEKSREFMALLKDYMDTLSPGLKDDEGDSGAQQGFVE